jgi:hypothetical protein
MSDWIEQAHNEAMSEVGSEVESPEVSLDSSTAEESSSYQNAMDDSDFDVPSSLDTIESSDEAVDFDSSEFQDEPSQSAPEPSSDLISYSANGQEFSATAEEAAKALSLVRGARRAFTDRAKLRRELKALKEQAEQAGVFKQKWEEVMADGATPEQVWEKLTGQSFDQWADQEIQRATPEEKQLLDYDRNFKALEQRQQQLEAERQQREKDLQDTAFKARVKYMQSQATPIFEKYIDQVTAGLSEAASQRRARMYWRESVRDLQDLKQRGYEPTPKLMEQIFRRNAAAIVGGNLDQVQQQVQQVIDQKKETAKEQAQVASTKNYAGPSHNMNDLVKKNPLDLFNLLRK